MNDDDGINDDNDNDNDNDDDNERRTVREMKSILKALGLWSELQGLGWIHYSFLYQPYSDFRSG